MTADQHDEMLQNMALDVREQYEEASGKVLGVFETQALNDMLDNFFCEELAK